MAKHTIRNRIQRSMTLTAFVNFLASFLVICTGFLLFINVFGTTISQSISYIIASSYSEEWNGTVKSQFSANTTKDAEVLLHLVQAKFFADSLLATDIPTSNDKTAAKQIPTNKQSIGEDYGFLLQTLKELIQVEIIKGKKVLHAYTDEMGMGIAESDRWTTQLIGPLIDTDSYTHIVDNNGKVIGTINVRMNQIIMIGIYLALVGLCFFVMLIVFFISKLFGRFLANLLVKPIESLQEKMDLLAEGDIKEAIHCPMKFVKPVEEIENLVSANNRIIQKMKDYIEFIEAQNAELEMQQEALTETNHQLHDKMAEVRNLLDNAGEGFLSFDETLLIQQSYSQECLTIFSCMPEGTKLSQLLFPHDETEQQLCDEVLLRLLRSEDTELYVPLLPQEIRLGYKMLAIRYRLIGEGRLMVIISDVTARKLLEQQIDRERNRLRAVVTILLNREEFIQLASDFRQLFANAFLLSNDELFRKVHTFRGNFAQYDFSETASVLNEIEQLLVFHQEVTGQHFDTLKGVFHEELATIAQDLGPDFFDTDETIHVKKAKLVDLENRIMLTFPGKEAAKIIPFIRRLQFQSLKKMLHHYAGFTYSLAQRLGRHIEPFTIDGDEIEVEYEQYSAVIDSLVHIFRNAIYHGIEEEEERVESGKTEMGRVRCRVVQGENDTFQIIVADDGRGIDVERVYDKAVRLGLVTTSRDECSDEQLFACLFAQQFSTVDEANTIAGRGVGLSAIEEEVTKLGGTIAVRSIAGFGTTFSLTLPNTPPHHEETTFETALSRTLFKKVSDYVRERHTLEVMPTSDELQASAAVQVAIGGDIELTVEIGVNEAFGDYLKCEYEATVLESLAEGVNTVVGQWLAIFDDRGWNLRLSEPRLNPARLTSSLRQSYRANDYEFYIAVQMEGNDRG